MTHFNVEVGHEAPPFIVRATRLAGGRAQAKKNLLTHALFLPVLPAFVRNDAYSPSIMASWGHSLLQA